MFSKEQYLQHISNIEEAVDTGGMSDGPPQYDPDSPVPIPYQKYNIPYNPAVVTDPSAPIRPRPSNNKPAQGFPSWLWPLLWRIVPQ